GHQMHASRRSVAFIAKAHAKRARLRAGAFLPGIRCARFFSLPQHAKGATIAESLPCAAMWKTQNVQGTRRNRHAVIALRMTAYVRLALFASIFYAAVHESPKCQ